MSFVNFSCTICLKNLAINDEIVSTQCGHVFHASCLKKRHKEAPQCPQCLTEIKTTVRLYLHFESSGANKEHQIMELRSEIDHLYKTRTQLLNELEASKRELQNLQGQYNKKAQEINEKNKTIELLTQQIKDYAKDITNKTIEIHKLKGTLNNKNPEALGTAYQEEIEVLKEKNKQISLELAKEIRNSSQLASDKMRLESMLEHSIKVLNNNKTDNNENPENEAKTEHSASKSTEAEEDQNEDFVKSVVIKNIKEKLEDEEAIRRYVYKLSDIMDLYFTGDDVLNVTVLNRYQGKMSLVVKLKTLGMKSMFLSRKDKLKQHDGMKSLFLYEYVADNTHSLFQHAKTLRFSGYKHVYCRNNVVLVKKKHDDEAIIINCRDDIQKLKAESENPAEN